MKDEMKQAEASHAAEELGEATGGISGVLVGAGIGSAAGPVGTLIGAIAGAIGGWWAGREVADSAAKLTREDDEYFREHYETQATQPADLGYDAVRGAYYLGHIASQQPDVAERSWTDVEPDLERGWTAQSYKYGSWKTVRSYAEEGFTRGRARRAPSPRAARMAGGMGEDVDRRS